MFLNFVLVLHVSWKFTSARKTEHFIGLFMTAVDRIKCRYAHSGMKRGLGGFQNPGVCLQAFPSFLPYPLPAYLRHFSRGLCSETARKRLLRRLFPCMHDSLVAELSDSLEKMMLLPFLVWRHIVYNYPPKGRWIVVDVYRDTKHLGIYPPLFTNPEGDSCL